MRPSKFKMIEFAFIFLRRSISVLGKPRSRLWREVRDRHLKENPECAVCGRRKNVVPHHVVPVHVDPSRELDPGNLISLCEGPAFNCHLFFGHLRDWSSFNPEVREDAKIWREKTKTRSN